jgi:transcriptional regulator with XRE-family HTH domain
MSTENTTKITNSVFISRLVELLGTDKPAEIGRKLEIDYQSAKNYLSGRKPSADVLERIVEKTNVSLNWLLMGSGPKYIKDDVFDLERSVERHADWTDVINEWYEFEGTTMPETSGASFMGGWQSFDKRQKLDAIRDFKRFLDLIKND